MEFVLRFDNQKPVQRKVNTRSRKGCFNCRKRKKKCDEIKPTCSTCDRKGISCVWPDVRQPSVPQGYVVPKTKKKNGVTLKEDISFPNLKEQTFESEPSPAEIGEIQMVLEAMDDSEWSPQNGLQLVPSPDNSRSLESALGTEIPLYVKMKHVYIQACINGFIKAVGPQHTHPLLTTSATFTPYVTANNRLMELVSVACGASFLSYEDPSLKPVAKRAYDAATEELNQRVNGESGLWLCAASQMLALCSKNIDINVKSTVKNLNNSYTLIKRRIGYAPNSYIAENLMVELENLLIHFEHHLAVTEKESERMFVESFVYNYSVSMLFSEPDSMPSPFMVFKDLRILLKKPILSCDVAWMNNPVVGAALDAFEVAAKASYLARHINDPNTPKQAKKLLNIANYYPAPMIPTSVLATPEKFERLKESVTVAEIVMRASLIILRKIVDLNIEAEDTIIQKDVKFIISKLRKINPYARVKTVANWALFIAGLACVTEEDRKLIMENFDQVRSLSRGQYLKTVKNALLASWEGNGLESLFDGELLGSVVM